MSEIQKDKNNYFYAVIYRSLSQDQTEFDQFSMNFELMLSKMKDDNPFCIIISDNFNCRSTYWWQNDNESNEGRLFESITSDLGLYQSQLLRRGNGFLRLRPRPIYVPYCKSAAIFWKIHEILTRFGFF